MAARSIPEVFASEENFGAEPPTGSVIKKVGNTNLNAGTGEP